MNEKTFEKYMEIVMENQIAIKHLTGIVEKTSNDIDKLVEKQNQIIVNQEEMKRINDKIEDNERRIAKLENSQTWVIRSIFGGIFTIIVGVLLFMIKGK